MRRRIGDKNLEFLSKEQLEEYAKWFDSLSAWTLRANISFRHVTSYARAKQRLKWFFKYMNNYGSMKYIDKRIRVLVFYERQNTSRGGVHIHALIDSINPAFVKIIEQRAKKYFGEASKVGTYDSSLGFKYYVAKKIRYSKLVDYGFYVIHSKIRHNVERSEATK